MRSPQLNPSRSQLGYSGDAAFRNAIRELAPFAS